MRDGKKLPTALYFPSTVSGEKLPCILLRNPSGPSTPFALAYVPLKERGYVVAIQTTRSGLDPEGKTFPFLSDGWGDLQDGYDTVECLAKCDWSNGKVGTIGTSAMGITQLLMAPSAPPSLRCQYVRFGLASMYHHATYPDGQLLKNQAERWLGYCARDPGVHSYVCTHPYYDGFWKQLNTMEVAHQVNVPGVLYGGWFDTFIQGTIDAFVSRQERGNVGAKGKQKLIIGPWHHYWPLTLDLGDFQVPPEGIAPPIDISPERWFDFHLKDINNTKDWPTVLYYVMGPFDGTASSGNRWKSADSWPPAAKETPFYFTQAKKLEKAEPVNLGAMNYCYDPNNPVPTIGGRNLFLESGPKDQREIEKREDVLVFTSAPLEKDVEVTGRLKAHIFLTSSAPNTDVSVRLSDVYPDGKSILIVDGHYRTGIKSKDEALDPTKPLKIEVDLWSTSQVFAKGHSIRVVITSSNYPRFEKNPNIGLLGEYSGNSTVACNTIYMGSGCPSCIILPIVEK
nr:CocE/NonD family hydrolase [Parachlamydia sp. AcF125]